jgi:hypothetical protein
VFARICAITTSAHQGGVSSSRKDNCHEEGAFRHNRCYFARCWSRSVRKPFGRCGGRLRRLESRTRRRNRRIPRGCLFNEGSGQDHAESSQPLTPKVAISESDEWPRRFRGHSFVQWFARSPAFLLPVTVSSCLGLNTPSGHATPLESTHDRQQNNFMCASSLIRCTATILECWGEKSAA